MRAHDVEASVRLAEIEANLLAGPEQMTDGADARAHDLTDCPADRALAEVLGPGDAQPAEIDGGRARYLFGAQWESQRLAIVHADLGCEE